MKADALWQLRIVTSPEAEEALSELLSVHLPGTATSYHHLETGQVWLTWFYQSRPKSPARLISAVKDQLARVKDCGLDARPGRISLTRLPREDWAESWKRHFKPLHIGQELLIKPSWSRTRPTRNQQVITIDPGLSFGTGQHPTTAFCLEQIVRHRPKQGSKSFLDIGTGSGILAISAAKLGYSPVLAFDFDPDAVRVAVENAALNAVQQAVRVKKGDIRKPPGGGKGSKSQRHYDLVCANLIANLLLEQQHNILATVAPKGVLVLAGILKAEFARVRASYERAGLKLLDSSAVNEWQSGSFGPR